ncbi:hypothetical protein [Baekduia alba]|uniref:hypothetical protein n=1 Tax=Baekduia alba TaxID=2997333 RepID=UPI002341F54E|nr:hypothetical protein [Baekduia alba]
MPTDGTHREVQFPECSVTTSLAMAPSSLTQPLARQQEAIMYLPHSVDMHASRTAESKA